MKKREPILQGVLITEFERAIIDELRTRADLRMIVCDVLHLPYDEETAAAIAERQAEEEKGMSRSEKLARRKEWREANYNRWKEFRGLGYDTFRIEFGQGKTRPHIQLVADNTGDGAQIIEYSRVYKS